MEANMATGAADPLATDGLGLVEALAARARTEVVELAAGLRMPRRQVREQLRRLEHGGVIRGYHAITRHPPDAASGVLVMLRFIAPPVPSAGQLCALDGVRRVHALCAGWDFMLEVDATSALLAQLSGGGHVAVLGARAEAEMLLVHGEHACPGNAATPPQYPLPCA